MTTPAQLEALIPPEALRADDTWWPKPSPRPFRLVVGARTLPPEEWLRPRPHDPSLVTWRRALLDAEGPRAFAALPGTEAAGQAVLDLIRAATGLPADADAWPGAAVSADGGGTAGAAPTAGVGGASGGVGAAGVASTVGVGGTANRVGAERHPLDVAGRLVAEDLCLVDLTDGRPRLVGASLAMPNRWLLAEKLGQDMIAVHVPVPGYAEQLSVVVDKFLTGLRENRIMTRANWAITDDPRLFQPAPNSRARQGELIRTPARASSKLYVRVEYQTLRLLPSPAGNTALFTIRTAHEPLGALADRPTVAADLASTIEVMPEADLDYKGVLPYRDVVLELLWGFSAVKR